MKVEFAELLKQIGAEIRNANDNAAQDGNAVMQFVECEVEVHFTTEKATKGGLKIYVLEAGTKKTTSIGNSIRLKYQALSGGALVAIQEVE